MALWHLYRQETDPNVGPVALECVDGEVALKFTLYDSDELVYATTTGCTSVTAAATDILHNLEVAGYTPNDWS